MAEESSSIDKVLSGEMKLEYIDQLELLKENLSSNSFLNNRSNKKDILKLVENLIDLMPVELRTARFIVADFSEKEFHCFYSKGQLADKTTLGNCN